MFQPFLVEQFLSNNEQNIRWNYSESGVHPMSVGELLDLAGVELASLRDVSLNYPEVNGDIGLREKIAGLYDNADADNVLVTVGASEANQIIAAAFLEAGDEVVALTPTYQQLTGNAGNLGIEIKTVPLVEDDGWALDTEALDNAVGPNTKLISLVNPHNPTGHIFTDDELNAIISAADRVGAWIVADEVYAGTERQVNQPTRSLWDRYERVLALNSMSKAYGLPGLRLGWVVAPHERIAELWRRHEYATISTTMLGNVLADIALDPANRPNILARSRRLIRTGFDVLQSGLDHHDGVFDVVPPMASAMSFVRYDLPISSLELAQRLIDEHSTLVVPGECFGMDSHFRFSSALPEPYLREGLARLNQLAGDILGQG